ncbi:MAG: hypothetical protein FWC26_08180 [Fibromonadales bacterium]|nr:hypothetical protein [Fibromonadales bacterium]
MQPRFFSWLFDDKGAWEKSIADPRYSYDLPIDSFMALYQIERKANAGGAAEFTLPVFTAPVMAQMPMVVASSPMAMPLAAAAPVAVAEPQRKEEPKQDGILSQEEIDALLSGS